MLLYALVRPGLTGVRAGRLGIVLAVAGPGNRESGVGNPARVKRRFGRIQGRQRRDRLQRRGIQLGGEELADRAVGDAHHPDLVTEDPRLVRDRLDHVVAVEVLELLEVVI